MKLVTLESISPTTTKELLRYLRDDFPVLPSPVTPAPTTRLSIADEITTALMNALVRMRIAQRNVSSGGVHVGASWIDMLPIPNRHVIHDLVFDLTAELDRRFDTGITEHLIIVVQVPVHECFERMLASMELRNLMLSDILAEKEFLETLRMRRCSSFYPVHVKTVSAVPCMMDNVVDLLGCKTLLCRLIRETFEHSIERAS